MHVNLFFAKFMCNVFLNLQRAFFDAKIMRRLNNAKISIKYKFSIGLYISVTFFFLSEFVDISLVLIFWETERYCHGFWYQFRGGMS